MKKDLVIIFNKEYYDKEYYGKERILYIKIQVIYI